MMERRPGADALHVQPGRRTQGGRPAGWLGRVRPRSAGGARPAADLESMLVGNAILSARPAASGFLDAATVHAYGVLRTIARGFGR